MIHYRDGVYHDGAVELDPTGEFFRYGFGVFETLLWKRSAVCRLEAHVARARSSLIALGVSWEGFDFAEVIPELARRNGLWNRTGRVNLHFPVEHGKSRPVVSASEYQSPSTEQSWRLDLSPRSMHSWLAAHKSTNYLYYHMEHRAAQSQGFDGAAVASPDGCILEAATAALVFAAGDALVTPSVLDTGESGPALLPSVALCCAREVLEISGRQVPVAQLSEFTHAWALNSLAGMRPVTQIGTVRYEPRFDISALAETRILRP
jgi:4-amino-4-deoxychorismate lyase